MANGNATIPLKIKSNKAAARDAAVQFIADERIAQGNNPQRVPRARIEAEIRVATGQTQAEVNAALIETYDDLTDLGVLTTRAGR